MISSPILHVELLTVGRRRRYFLLRVAYGLLLLFALFTCYGNLLFSHRPTLQAQAEFAFAFFIAYSFIQLGAVLLLTPAMTSGTISSEHERRTIDYLLTTQLNDFEIALGKFTARLWAVAMLLAVGLPVLALAMSLGGIGFEQLLTSFLVSVLTLASVGSLSICISARAAKSREAITRTYLVIAAAMIVPPTLMGVAYYLKERLGFGAVMQPVIDATMFCTMLNPVVFLPTALFDRMGQASSMGLTVFAAVHAGLSLVLCASAVVGVRRFYRNLSGRAKAIASSGSRRRRKTAARPAVAAAGDASDTASLPLESVAAREVDLPPRCVRRARLLESRGPMWWKEMLSQKTFLRLGWTGRIASVLLFGAAIFWLGTAFIESFNSSRHSSTSSIMVFAMAGVPTIAIAALLLIASRAAGGITAEKEQDTWTTLISTPLDGRDIVPAKAYGAIYSVRQWYYLIAVTWVLCALRHPETWSMLPFLVVMHATAALFCAFLGVAFSLRMKTSLQAIGSTLSVLVLGVTFVPLMFAMIVQAGQPSLFALPVCLAMFHGGMWEVMENGFRPGTETYAVFVVISWLAYVFATAVLRSVCIGAFESMSGRIEPQPGRRSGPGMPSGDYDEAFADGDDTDDEDDESVEEYADDELRRADGAVNDGTATKDETRPADPTGRN